MVIKGSPVSHTVEPAESATFIRASPTKKSQSETFKNSFQILNELSLRKTATSITQPATLFLFEMLFVCIIRDADFNSDRYRLPAIMCVCKFFFHFVFSFQKIRCCRPLVALRLSSILMCLKIDMTIITIA